MTTYEPADWRPQPGDVAEVTEADGDGPELRCFLKDGWWMPLNGYGLQWNRIKRARRLQVVDPASVVVLDPDNPDDVKRLWQASINCEQGNWPYAEALRSLLLPSPTPPEPNGLGAVVECINGNFYELHRGKWWHTRISWSSRASSARRSWPAFTASSPAHRKPPSNLVGLSVVRVLSHGVGCTCGAPDCPGDAS